jgi:hypothetical protein
MRRHYNRLRNVEQIDRNYNQSILMKELHELEIIQPVSIIKCISIQEPRVNIIPALEKPWLF